MKIDDRVVIGFLSISSGDGDVVYGVVHKITSTMITCRLENGGWFGNLVRVPYYEAIPEEVFMMNLISDN